MSRVAWWVALSGIAALLVIALTVGAPETWRWLGVPALSPRWADVRHITEGLKCEKAGLDPMQENPCDPWNRRMNYPRIWLRIADVLGGSAMVLALGMSALFIGAITAVFWRLNLDTVVVCSYALALFSPPALLAFERGNTDLLVVALAGFAAVVLARPSRAAFGVGAALVVAASLLKLFPTALIGLLWLLVVVGDQSVRRARAWIAGVVTIVVCAAFIAQHDDLGYIARATPRPTVYAYGLRTYGGFVDEVGLHVAVGGGALYSIAVGVLLASILVRRPVAVLRSTPHPVNRLRLIVADPAGVALLSGLILFIATMAFANHPYKLIVLSLALPYCAIRIQANDDDRHAARALVATSMILGLTACAQLWTTGTASALLADLVMLVSLGVIGAGVSVILRRPLAYPANVADLATSP